MDGELPLADLQVRLGQLALSIDEIKAPFKIYTPDLQIRGATLNLAIPNHQDVLDQKLDDVDLIIVDSISTLCRVERENEGDDWLVCQDWALRQRQAGRSVLFVHHAGKSGQQRGTSRREDVLDSVVLLRKSSKSTATRGAEFDVVFEKARGFYGKNAATFKASLVQDDQGRLNWRRTDRRACTLDRVLELYKQGNSQTDIARIIPVDKSTVSRNLAKLRAEGLI